MEYSKLLMFPESLWERVESFDPEDAADSDFKTQHSYIGS